MLSTKITLGAASLTTAAALAIAVSKTPQTQFEEMNNAEKTEYLAKQAEKKQARTYTWNNKESVVSNVIEGAKTTGNIVAQGAEKTTDYPVHLTAALALELLGLGAVSRKKKDKLYEVDSPIGKIKVTKQGAEDYLKLLDLYNRNLAMKNDGFYSHPYSGSFTGEILEAKLKMEVLKSLHSLSDSGTISSETFGDIKVTKQGVKDYLKLVELYSRNKGMKDDGFYSHPFNGSYEEEISKAKSKIEVLKSLHELPESGCCCLIGGISGTGGSSNALTVPVGDTYGDILMSP